MYRQKILLSQNTFKCVKSTYAPGELEKPKLGLKLIIFVITLQNNFLLTDVIKLYQTHYWDAKLEAKNQFHGPAHLTPLHNSFE